MWMRPMPEPGAQSSDADAISSLKRPNDYAVLLANLKRLGDLLEQTLKSEENPGRIHALLSVSESAITQHMTEPQARASAFLSLATHMGNAARVLRERGFASRADWVDGLAKGYRQKGEESFKPAQPIQPPGKGGVVLKR